MATALELAFEKSMTSTLYSICGISVTYTSISDGSSSIQAVPEIATALFANQLVTQTNEREQKMRVKKTDVQVPHRGDRITNLDGNIFVVETFEQENYVEWNLTLRVCEDG